jgi:E1 Protein, N terminal domain
MDQNLYSESQKFGDSIFNNDISKSNNTQLLNSTKAHTYSFEDAIRRYETIREPIYKELEIQFVQEKVKNKILKKNPKNVELLFHKTEDEISNMSDLLSDMDNSEIVSEVLLTKQSGECIDDSIVDNEEHSHIEEKDSESQCLNIRRKTKNKYLDIEAECSEEEMSMEQSIDEDLEDFIDANYSEAFTDNAALSLFAEEDQKRDMEQIRKLKEKYVKRTKKPQKIHKISKIEESSFESISDIEELDIDKIDVSEIEYPHKPIRLEKVAQGSTEIKDNDFFNVDDKALDKLTKNEDNVGFGFKKM